MEAERRQITVLFTDMVGFTTFSERAGEEAAFALMGSLWPLMDDAVREQGVVVGLFFQLGLFPLTANAIAGVQCVAAQVPGQ